MTNLSRSEMTVPLPHTFEDGHEHEWEPSTARVGWICALCGAWTHHEPRPLPIADEP